MEEFLIDEIVKALKKQPNLRVTFVSDKSRCINNQVIFLFSFVVV